MVTKNQLNDWIANIDKLRRDLHTGGGALISAGYSKENEELYKAASSVRNLMTIYYSYNGLNEEHINRLGILIDDMRMKALKYEEAKAKDKKKPYSLEGNPRKGIIAARGDKYTRLKAADDINKLSLQIIKPILRESLIEAQTRPPVILNKEYNKIEKKLGSGVIGAEDISKNINSFIKDDTPKMEILNYHRESVSAKEAYDNAVNNSFLNNNEITVGELYDDFKEIKNLHRLELMNYKDSKEFLDLYNKNRYKIRQVVEIYNKAEKWKDGSKREREFFKNFRVAMGLTQSGFEELAGKISTLEMIGRHMDARISMSSNPEFTNLSLEQIREVYTTPATELDQKIKSMKDNLINPQMPDEFKPSKGLIELYESVKDIRKLEDLGIKTRENSDFREEKSLVNRTVGDSVKRNFKFLNGQLRAGRSQMKKDYMAGDFDYPILAKAKLGKVSLKYSTKNKLFSAGVHGGVLGGRVMSNVGIGFSLKHPLSIKAQIQGLAEGYGARGVAKTKLGNSDIGILVKAEGHIGHAKAEENVGIGHIYKRDKDGNLVTDGFGVTVKAGASASVFNGKISSGFSVFGVRFSFSAEGKALAAGIEGEFTFLPNRGLRLGGGGALGLGGNIYLSVDWKDLVDKFKNWKKRRAISKATLEARKAEKRKLEEEKRRQKEKIREEKKRKLKEAKNAAKGDKLDKDNKKISKDNDSIKKKTNPNNKNLNNKNSNNNDVKSVNREKPFKK
ncbi:MAG: hypothetical protein K6E10_05380 [Eubacterium sp.]|nr:hypothetical protein [Eubacterium sp.]